MARSADAASARSAWLLALLVATAACEGRPNGEDSSASAPAETESQGGVASPCEDPEGCDEARGSDCEAPIPVFENGAVTSEICEAAAEEAGLTVVDLSDDWAPRVLAGGPDGPVPYRETYVQMANEQFGDDPVWDRTKDDRFLELFGIFPSLTVIRARLLDDERHACHAAVDDAGLTNLGHDIDTWKPAGEQRGDLATAAILKRRLESELPALDMKRIEELDGAEGAIGAFYAKYKKITTRAAAVSNMKEHLRCEGLYEGDSDGIMDTAAINAMQAFHRRHMIISWQLDEETKRILMANTRELDFLTTLRALRERVVDATGLIEDGTASGREAEVAGRKIDTAVFLDDVHGEPLDDGAPDLIGQATDAAATALGWTSHAKMRKIFEAGDLPKKVALRLPAPPAYHREHMDLRVTIDRGDVWYDFPFSGLGDRFVQPREHRPSLVVYTEHEGRAIPLLRWPTTIGGWQPEKVNGRTMVLYKESPAGPGIYRDIVAAPRWVPPKSTPTRDLLRPRGNGVYVPKYDSFGPHYASAYGLAMMIHHRIDRPGSAEPTYTDQGIRTHGSASYDSILDGYSHGCHRLHNHRAMRLTSFFLAHRNHVVHGPLVLDFGRTLYYRNTKTPLYFDSRGYRYELTPPVEIEVLRGRIMGGSAKPAAPRKLPYKLLKRYDFQ